MEENLVIVESPAKAKTIQKFLGDGFVVTSCFGHIRDLSKKNNGIDIAKNYEPIYEVPSEKKKLVSELKKLAKQANMVWLASDEDREGEAIAWHLYEALGLKENNTKRIVFHEITKDAILNSIKTPRSIDQNLVNAQQARRILDRLVGFELSPLLWKKIKPSLSAGRVQSVAVRLIVEREREIFDFKSTSSYRIIASFINPDDSKEFKAELSKRFKTKKEALEFLGTCKNANFKISDISTVPSKRTPAAPFTTSTLQQEASRKLGFSVARTMSVAQKLYESGKITYMRTDSLNLSSLAIGAAANEIKSEFGDEYVKTRTFKSKIKGAQEAHEAIRPTYMNSRTISGPAAEQSLYELIWKRTIASQMSDAQIEKTTATILMSNSDEKFLATGEVIKFDGFLRVYIESTDDDKEENQSDFLPKLSKGKNLTVDSIIADERFTNNPPRYTEASLVKKLEELGIGRPSTYAPTISTIQNRGYVVKENRDGYERSATIITLKNDKISEKIKTEKYGYEKGKMFPSDIGMIVNDFLVEYFKDILDYNFTAKVEKEFDEIADGNVEWKKMIDSFYKPFHLKIADTEANSERGRAERMLGLDPKSGKNVYAKYGKFGPVIQIGEKEDEQKPQFASITKGMHIEQITLEDALKLFALPRNLGQYEDLDVIISVGRFGPYVRHGSSFYSLKLKGDELLNIQLNEAIEIIIEGKEKEKKKIIKTFNQDDAPQILNGRFGAYISYKKKNYKIPKKQTPEDLTFEECMKIIESSKK
ncbi:MAG TPA: type I DNA topoisomerase [Bacteroidales bacterium]|nr:MAG: DNA topoisomerase I [Bacteroidetes bacterium GWF2_33_38]OFY67927.1 MAG: DNA topoisomerase I [Bacteroidetes bacterium RIFOXYA12_FULL_33_9]OFY85279.1 MAG: DNA topoisomerase I [Bacteroidetes bacterium RIFOXYA2_FULL_33_7]HBF87477.1 type I DNA topoisomerase [Bacteroidales bacterium]